MSRRVSLALGLLFFGLFSTYSASHAAAQDEAHEHLKPLGFLVGEWIGKYELPAGVPEIGGEKGATVIQRVTTKWVLDGAAIEMTFRSTIGGKKRPVSREMIAWDPANERITHVIIDGSGFFGDGVWRKQDGDWLLEWKAGTKDGTYSGTSIHREKSDTAFLWQMVGIQKDDDKLPDWPKVEFRRVGSLHKEWIKYLAGKWQFTLGDGRTGTVTWTSAGTTPALSFTGETEEFSIVGVLGWSEVEQKFVESDFVTQEGTRARLHREYAKMTKDTLTGKQIWWDTELGKGGQALQYRRISDDEMTLTGKASDSGGTDWVVRFKRHK